MLTVSSPKGYFDDLLQAAMQKAGYNRNFLVKDFLLDILLRLDPSTWVFSPRKEDAIYTAKLLDYDSEKLNQLAKRMLFMIGMFPEHLLATGQRVVDIEYYIRMEKVFIGRLSHRSLPWKMIYANYPITLHSLVLVRKKLDLDGRRLELLERRVRKSAAG